MLLRDVVDELLNEHRLAHAGTTEQTHLAALHIWGEQVDDLDAGLEDLGGRRQLVECRRLTVNRPPLGLADRAALVNRLSEHIEDAAQSGLAHGDRDRTAGVNDVGAARQAVGGIEGHRTHLVVAEELLHLSYECGAVGTGDLKGVVDARKVVAEADVKHDALDLEDRPGVLPVGAHLVVIRPVRCGFRCCIWSS